MNRNMGGIDILLKRVNLYTTSTVNIHTNTHDDQQTWTRLT